ncbi:unnamed protein product [Blepharisma stoltei]|uniref:Major facilitator superfamily (MFS) profile domain-containing protein n=1 Tax=Blepharisma stoltei TaxID=1481888 RepID=A0AAU9K6I5_9CILI|nr:unnamed protein product [Blepharisma stoltei]
MRTTLMDFISIFIAYFASSSIDPTLSNFITSNFSVSDANVGFFFCITTSCFTVSILILSRFKGVLKYKVLILLNLLILAFSLFAIGPISVLHIPPNFANLSLSLALIGVGLLFGMVSFLPDMAADAFMKAPYLEKSHVLDKLSALLALGVWSGRAAGPPISGYLRDHMEFQDSEAIIGFVVFIYMLAFGVYGGGFQLIKNIKKKTNRIEAILIESEMIEAKRSFYYLEEEETF